MRLQANKFNFFGNDGIRWCLSNGVSVEFSVLEKAVDVVGSKLWGSEHLADANLLGLKNVARSERPASIRL